MIFADRVIPQTCNIPAILRAREIEKKQIGMTAEALAYQKEIGKHLASIWDGKDDSKFIAEYKRLCGQIINTDIDLMLYTTSLATGMFEIINVTGNNIPAYTLWTTPELNITRMATHGHPQAVTAYMSATQYFPSFYYITTDRVYQPRQSILTGEVGPNALINSRARYEIEQAIEDDIWTLLAAAVGSFTAASTWVYDTRIQSVPSTNAVSLTAQGGLTKELMQGILAAVDLVPSRTSPGGVASIRNMFIPHSKAEDLREWISVVSSTTGLTASQDAADTVSPGLQREIEMRGPSALDNLWGENIGIKRINRLMGTTSANFAKFLWVFLNGPVGRLYLKTDEDYEETLTDQMPYATGMRISRMIGMEIPDPYKPNFMLVQFAS